MSGLVGAIEAGGTKFRVAVARGPELTADITIPTTTPAETLGAVIEFLGSHQVNRVGVACFGPVGLDESSPTYGHTLATPKPGWSDVDVKGPIERGLGRPVIIDTDVAAAGLAEWKWGAGQGHRSLLYLTIGTGVGGALIVDGRVHHGHGHSEMGHIAIERIEGDPFAGSCPYHGGCLEGLAAGPAIIARWGRELTEAGPDAAALEASYLAQALRGLTYVLAPDVIVMGGGVMQTPSLLATVRVRLEAELGGYSTNPSLVERLEDYLVAPAFDQDAGLVGAVALAVGES